MNKKDFIKELKVMLELNNGEIIQFIEDEKELGNVTLIINVNGILYKFETDRGEVLLNNKTVFPVFQNAKSRLSKYEKLILAIKKTI